MKYQAYPEYKDSGNQFVANIPSTWCRRIVGALSDVIDPQPDHRAPVICDDGEGFPYIGIRDVNKDGTLNFETARPVEESAVLKQEKSFTIEAGNIVFCKVGTLGLPRKVLPHGRCALSATLVLIKVKENYNSQFVLYALGSDVVVAQTDYLATGSTRAALGIQQIRKFQIPFPSENEQQKIANFLDHETAKIDTLIEKQQQLIKLLKEKRQAVISLAVTKGLNPNAPMRDSGVEWLGEVPEHWVVKKFSRCVSIRNGQVDPRYLPYSEYTLIAPNHIESNTGRLLSTETASEQGADSGKYLCKEGEVIYSKIRPALAKVCFSPNNQTICSADIYPMKGIDGLTNGFLYLILLSGWFTSLVILESDRVAMPKINREKLAEVQLPIPPEQEQLRICSGIKEKLSVIDSLLAKANKSIRLSNERRIALISAAVTGKIDVRGWQAPESFHNNQAINREDAA